MFSAPGQQIVGRHHLIALAQQAIAQMRSEKASSSGHQRALRLHRVCVLTIRRAPFSASGRGRHSSVNAARTPHTVIRESVLHHHCRIVQIPPIEHDGILHQRAQTFQIQRREFFPLGQDQQRIGALAAS